MGQGLWDLVPGLGDSPVMATTLFSQGDRGEKGDRGEQVSQNGDTAPSVPQMLCTSWEDGGLSWGQEDAL